ncbi:MAG: hypothetical protein K9I68_00990 [Bacteroidales bacterium]|nr:hypothetical protein [Bacteroidales bacterium]MCF8336920.1 hypothetical protein [Bacteroidales bacterium]
MKRFLKSLGKVVLVIIVLFVGFLWYAGFFDKVSINHRESGPYYALVSEVNLYEDPANVRNKIFKNLINNDIMSERGVAITNQPFRENLIRQTGWIIKSKNIQLANNLEPPYKIIEIPKKERLVAEFPYNNSFSIMSGSYIVYRRLLHSAQKQNLKTGKMIEVYDDGAEKIFYHLNIKQSQITR